MVVPLHSSPWTGAVSVNAAPTIMGAKVDAVAATLLISMAKLCALARSAVLPLVLKYPASAPLLNDQVQRILLAVVVVVVVVVVAAVLVVVVVLLVGLMEPEGQEAPEGQGVGLLVPEAGQ